ncbi:hypothetical protein LTR53_017906, partial [Teratosphaeriaceae sp. CCFEE 6253]
MTGSVAGASMAAATYQPVRGDEEKPPGSAGSSQESSTSARFTPETASDDEADDLGDLEAKEGYELEDLGEST